MNLKQYLENTNSKKLIIMRGLPGSGKSYTAKQLGGYVFSTDDEFMINGNYEFDGAKLIRAHKNTQEKVLQAFKKGLSPIILDNTNVTYDDMKYYVLLAEQYDYNIEFKESTADWWTLTKDSTPEEKEKLADILAKKNEHGVPKDNIIKMINRWKHYDSSRHQEFIDKIKSSKGF
jgi:predicted kinase